MIAVWFIGILFVVLLVAAGLLALRLVRLDRRIKRLPLEADGDGIQPAVDAIEESARGLEEAARGLQRTLEELRRGNNRDRASAARARSVR